MTNDIRAAAEQALKPCPLCGGHAVVDGRSDDVRVRCESCGTTGPVKFWTSDDDDEIEEAERDAIKAWNTRAALAEQPQPARIDPMQNPLRPTLARLGPPDEHPAEEVLRKLACWLGVGGYNAPSVDADLFHRKIVDGIEMLLASAAPPAAPPEQPQPEAPSGWIACDERMPEAGAEVLVWLAAPAFKGGSHVVMDTWDEQHEAPVAWSSATLPIGMGWDSGTDWESITHWMPLPAAPGSPPPPAAEPSEAEVEAAITAMDDVYSAHPAGQRPEITDQDRAAMRAALAAAAKERG